MRLIQWKMRYSCRPSSEVARKTHRLNSGVAALRVRGPGVRDVVRAAALKQLQAEAAQQLHVVRLSPGDVCGEEEVVAPLRTDPGV